MLKRVTTYGDEYGPEFRDGEGGGRDLDHWVRVCRRQARVIALGALAGALVGLAFIVSAVPQYTATTNLLIDSRKDPESASSSIAETVFDPGAIDSQVEVLRSSRVGLAVVADLDLTNNPEFTRKPESTLRRALNRTWSALGCERWLRAPLEAASRSALQHETLRKAFDWTRSALGFGRGLQAPPEAESRSALQQDALARLEKNLEVRRVDRTYVLAIDFTSPNSKLAAAIANAFASAYLADQLDSHFEASDRLVRWMQTRIAQLKTDSLNSDLAVQKFKTEHGLVTADGKLVSDEQLTQLLTQLMSAQSDTARTKARIDKIDEMLKSGKIEGADALDSSVLTELRQKFLAASGSRPRLAADYQRQISEELARIADSYRSEAQVAKAKEDTLRQSMATLMDEHAEANRALVQLRELERESDNYRSLYQNFLQRYQEIIQRQTAPLSEARVITAAFPPEIPAYPRKSLILALSLVLGSMAGVGVGVLREYWDRVFRNASQVHDELGMEFLGMLQFLDRPSRLRKAKGLPLDPRRIVLRDSRQRYAIDHPLSRFSETLRSIKLTADIRLADRQPKVIGIISALSGEGKSFVSTNMASLLACLGASTLLIDGDLRVAELTSSIAGHATEGILEAIRGLQPLDDVILTEPDTGLRFLPAVVGQPLYHPGGVLSSPGMRELLAEAGKDFDYVIVDLPPVGAVADVAAAATAFDAFIFVVAWGTTPRVDVQSILASDTTLRERCLGVVFNKVDMERVGVYQSHGSRGYYPYPYSQYFREDGPTHLVVRDRA